MGGAAEGVAEEGDGKVKMGGGGAGVEGDVLED